MRCRGCLAEITREVTVCDLGVMPLANRLLDESELGLPETYWPLKAIVCPGCLLVQLESVPEPGEMFTDEYPFFAGQSATWLAHCRNLADEMAGRFALGATSRVLDIGSNDGTMLRRFRGKGIPAIGVEPCAGVAQHALMEGLPTIIDWWGLDCVQRLLSTPGVPTGKSWRADLVIATNVLAHVPDPHHFLTAVRQILAPGGVALFEVPYAGRMLAEGQWDQIYHEHQCYFSVMSLRAALDAAGLDLVDVEHLPVHGGSIRALASTAAGSPRPSHDRVNVEVERELGAGLASEETYTDFASRPPQDRLHALEELRQHAGKRVAGYGASAKAAVTLNYHGLGRDTIEFIADSTPGKQGRYIPGARIPIVPQAHLERAQPDVIVNFAWNWRSESERNIRRRCPEAEIVYLRALTTADAA